MWCVYFWVKPLLHSFTVYISSVPIWYICLLFFSHVSTSYVPLEICCMANSSCILWETRVRCLWERFSLVTRQQHCFFLSVCVILQAGIRAFTIALAVTRRVDRLAENNSQKLFIYQLRTYNAMACSTIEPAVASLSGFHGEDLHIITAIAGKVSCLLRSEVRRKKRDSILFLFFLGERQFSLRVWFQWMSPNQKICEEHKLHWRVNKWLFF